MTPHTMCSRISFWLRKIELVPHFRCFTTNVTHFRSKIFWFFVCFSLLAASEFSQFARAHFTKAQQYSRNFQSDNPFVHLHGTQNASRSDYIIIILRSSIILLQSSIYRAAVTVGSTINNFEIRFSEKFLKHPQNVLCVLVHVRRTTRD